MGEVEEVVDEGVLGLAEDAALVPLGDDMLHLLPRDESLPLALQPEQGERRLGGEAEHRDQHAGETGEEVDRLRHAQRHLFRVLKSDGLRYQFPQDEGEVGDGAYHHADGERLGGVSDHREGGHEKDGADVIDRDDTAHRGRGRTDDGYADLHDGEQAVRVLLQRLDQRGALVAHGDQLRYAAFSYGDDGEFGAGEKSVQQYEDGYDQQFDEDGVQLPSGSSWLAKEVPWLANLNRSSFSTLTGTLSTFCSCWTTEAVEWRTRCRGKCGMGDRRVVRSL